jgi:serine protease Do
MNCHENRLKKRTALEAGTLGLMALPVLLFCGCAASAGISREIPPSRSVSTAQAGSVRAQIQKAVDAVYPALVRIQVVMEEGQDGRMQKHEGTGSGTIISKDGYILTNHHVAGRGTRIICRLASGEEVDADLVGTDALSDLSVLKLNLASRRDPSAALPHADFGDSDSVRVGDTVLAMGCPAGLSQSVTEGIVANTALILPRGTGSFELDGELVGELVRWIGHDAVIYPGNSGGPLVNLRGEIIGVNEVGIGSLGGAIPSNLARSVVKELIAHKTVARSWIGVGAQPLLKEMTGGRGILVGSVFPRSPALDAGIQAGDCITRINGHDVKDSRIPEDVPLFNRLVLETPVGSPVKVEGLRKDKPMTWTLVPVAREPLQAREAQLTGWGLTVRDFTRVSALEHLRKDRKGVIIDSVRQGGPSASCKPPLRPGDILVKAGDLEIENVKALEEFTRQFTKGADQPKPLLVTYERNSEQFVTVPRVGPDVQDDKPSRPDKAWLGIETQVLTSEISEALGIDGRKGVRVTAVFPDSAAEQAGIKVGDLLFKFDGSVISASTPGDQELFDNMVRACKLGTSVELEGQREGKPLKLTANLGKRPKTTSELNEFKDDRFELTARELTLRERVSEKLDDSVRGVRLSAVQNAGWAELAGLTQSDIVMSINGIAVPDIATFKQTLLNLRDSKPRRVVFFAHRGIHTFFAEIEPKW